MFSLTEINKLAQWIDPITNDIWFIIDVPNVASPTGFDTYKVNADSIQGYRNFIDLQDTPPFYVAPGIEPGFVPAINLASDGLEFVPPTLYDSGWKPIPIWNGSYGLADTGNVVYRPKIRIVGRVAYLSGYLLLPMPTVAGGGVLDTNGFNYTLQGKMFSDLYIGADGWTIDGRNTAVTQGPILPSALRPDEVTRNLHQKAVMTKAKNITGGRMNISAWLGNAVLLPDGRLVLVSLESQERNGDLGVGWNRNNHSRKIVDNWLLGDKLMNYDNYRNAFDNLGADTLRVPNVEGYTFEYDFDGSRSNDFGGFIFQTHTSYPLHPHATYDQIKTAFDAL